MLQISLLGNVSITLDGQPVGGLPSRAAEALLIYLACHEHPFPRETLGELLWADRSQKQALTNLRTILTGLKRELGDYLLITRQSIAFNHEAELWLDSARLEEQLTQLEPALRSDSRLTEEDIKQLQSALDLYQGDFLAGFYLRDGRGFEEWAVLQRERLRRIAATGFRQLVHSLLNQGDYVAGIQYADRLLLLDPYDEDVHQEMMWMQARGGKRNAALKQYQAYRERLLEDLGVEPSSATTTLYERLRSTPFPPPQNLPQLSSPFVGRDQEIELLVRRLSSPMGRLVSILGPGGVGKTRLAIEAARRLAQTRPGQFLDGLTFVPLAALPSSAYLTITLGEVLNVWFEGEEPSLDQLLQHLKHLEMLLVLDNFEHLVDQTSLDWLVGILNAAPAVKILLTSRERLRLREEQVLDLGGLSYPPTGTDEEIASNFGSIQLFFQQIERIQKGYSPTPDDLKAIIQLCQLVDGMPLGIELAAAGVRYISPQDILIQLREKANLEFSQAPDRPERHQNLHAVFEHSWSLLSQDEQQTARRLAVFEGSFDMEAAEFITGATKNQLALLLDKSFLRRDARTGGFDLHPLMQQYLKVKLDNDPEEERSMRTRHADYFAVFIVVPGHPKSNMEQHFHELKKIVVRNQENIIHAALWFAEQHDFSDRKLATLIERLNFFFNTTHRFENLKVVYQQLIESLQEWPDGTYEEKWLTAVLEARIAYADINLHALQRANKRLDTLIHQAYGLKNLPLISYCHSILGLIAWRQGDFMEAFKQLEISLETVKDMQEHFRWPSMRVKGDIEFAAGQLDLSKATHDEAYALALEKDSFDEAAPHHRLSEGRVRHRWGELPAARRFLTDALALSRPKGIPAEIVSISLYLAHVLIDLGHYQEAEILLAEAKEITNEIKDSLLHALILRQLGWLAECTADLKGALQHLQKSLELLETIGDQSELPFTQVALGRILALMDETDAAQANLSTALKTFERWDHGGGTAITLHGLGLNYEQEKNWVAAENAYLAGLAAVQKSQEYYFGAQLTVQLAHTWAKQGLAEQALAILSNLQDSPAITAHDKRRATDLGESLKDRLGPSEIAAAQAWGSTKKLSESIAEILMGRDDILPETGRS